jgi:hypothetical protein
VRSVIGNGCLEMRMSTTSRGSKQLSEGYTDFRFRAYCWDQRHLLLCLYHRTISSYSYGYVGGVDTSIHIHINRRQLPNCALESHGRGKPDDASYRRTTSGCSHRQIRACTIERQRYSRTVSSRGCSNYVRTYIHSDVHDDRRHVQWCIYSGRWNGDTPSL